MYIKPCPEKIRAARRKQGLSAYALAMKAGLDKKAIYRIESKESLRTHSLRAQAIADALGCPVEELFDYGMSKSGKSLNYTHTKNPLAGPRWDEAVMAAEGDAMAADLARYMRRMLK